MAPRGRYHEDLWTIFPSEGRFTNVALRSSRKSLKTRSRTSSIRHGRKSVRRPGGGQCVWCCQVWKSPINGDPGAEPGSGGLNKRVWCVHRSAEVSLGCGTWASVIGTRPPWRGGTRGSGRVGHRLAGLRAVGCVDRTARTRRDVSVVIAAGLVLLARQGGSVRLRRARRRFRHRPGVCGSRFWASRVGRGAGCGGRWRWG